MKFSIIYIIVPVFDEYDESKRKFLKETYISARPGTINLKLRFSSGQDFDAATEAILDAGFGD
ncbi:MAG: hypothetical protein MJY80_00180 [Bacteroidales bacterium]|nr:hypothetical protein [Bacteroidales bacterium]